MIAVSDGSERHISEIDEHILLERHLDGRWEMEAPGIYRLREDEPRAPSAEPGLPTEQLPKHLAADVLGERKKPKRRSLKRLKGKNRH